MIMKSVLTAGEENLLRNPGTFYGIKDLDVGFEKKPFFLNSESELTNVEFNFNYKPCFRKYEEIYKSTDNILKMPLYLSKGKPYSTCLILIHGLKSKNKKIYIQLAERFCKKGISAAVYTLPFHFERSLNDLKVNALLNQPDFSATIELFRQAVVELRIIINIIKSYGYKKVGCLGFSFGGYCCSLLACFEKDLDFSIPLGSKGDFSSLINFKNNKTSSVDKEMDFNKYLAENYMKLICPINYKPIIDEKNILFIQGLFDNRTPFKDIGKLRKVWNYPPVIWYPCDHATFFLFNRLTLILAANFIKKIT
jgi:hypothetical protein